MSPLPVLLVVASLAVFVIEVLVVSFGALTLVAIGLGAGGVLLAFQEGPVYGWSMLGVLVVGIPAVVTAAFRILPKLPFARGLYLKAPERRPDQRQAAAETYDDLVGQAGVATSPLRPSGSADFGGRAVHVVTTGGMIERGARIRVREVAGNRIVVEAEPSE